MPEVNSKTNEGKLTPAIAPLPPDDPKRNLTIAEPNEDGKVPRIGLVGDTSTILLSGKHINGQ